MTPRCRGWKLSCRRRVEEELADGGQGAKSELDEAFERFERTQPALAQSAADILAHLGWAHWLNEKMAFKEFGGAESALRQSIAIDASNASANAMLGNWLLQTHGDSATAMRHFQTALASGTRRPLVRQMQLGGLLYNDGPGLRAEFAKVLNEMRSHDEPVEAGTISRARYMYDVTTSQGDEFRDVLAAVPREDNWKTYLWLSAGGPTDAAQRCRQDFVHASLAEVAGDRTAALTAFKAVLPVLKAQRMSSRMIDYSQAAISRLSR